MEILETVPIYGLPAWPVITFFVGLGIAAVAAICLRNTDYAGAIVAIIGLIAALVGIIFMFILHNSKFDHNEYVVRITDMPAQEFYQKYDITKRFEYSDAIQVKEIEK